MTTNALIMKGFDIHGRLFSYMFSLPIAANRHKRRLLLNTSPFWKLIPWISMILFVLFHGCGTCLYLIITELFKRRKFVNLLNFIVFVVVATLYWAAVALNLITFYHAKEAVAGSNQLLELEKRMSDRFPLLSKNATQKVDIRGLVVFSEVIVASVCPILFTIMIIYEDLDPTYFLLRDILPDVVHWNIRTIMSCLLLRFCVLIFGALEAARSLSLCIAFFIAGLEVYTKIMRILLRLSRRGFMVYYREFRLAHYIIKQFVDKFMAFGLSSLFITLVCLLWATIRTYGKVHWFLYIGCLVTVSILIAATLLSFPRVVELYESTTAVVNKWKLMSSHRWDFKRVGKRDGRAQAPLYFSCHYFYPFKKSSMRKFYSTVMEYWFTSVILVNF